MKTLSLIFAAAGLLALGYCAFVFLNARHYQTEAAHSLMHEKQPANIPPGQPQQPRGDTDAERPYPARGAVIGSLEISRLSLSIIVVEGAGDDQLRVAAGHIPGTALPGEGGNFAVAAHRDTFFRPLRLIRMNDTISLSTTRREYHYRVVSMEIVQPRDIQVLYPTMHDTLTLVTCYPFNFVGAAPSRFIVRAECDDCTP